VNDESNVIPPAPTSTPTGKRTISRRGFVARATAAAGLAGLLEMNRQAEAGTGTRAPISPRESIKITKLETFILRNSWVFVKLSTDAGITGWGEMLKDKSKTCAAGAHQVESYLIGKDPRHVVQHWQAIYRHSFYRGGPVLTAVVSGIDQALWDIKGKALGVPVYELLGGPTRDKIRVYGSSEDVTRGRAKAFKTSPRADGRAAYKYVESPSYIQKVAKDVAALREKFGPEVDIGVDFHGAVQPQTAHERLLATLDKNVEGWRQQNSDPLFLEWLAQLDPFSGAARSDLLAQAYERFDAPRVEAFFKGYRNEHAVVTPPAAAAAPAPQAASQRTLEDFVAPGQPKAGGSTGAQNGAGKRIWTQAEIKRFYDDCTSGKFKANPDRRKQVEQDIIDAAREGRVR
jgi:hypothetical protein